MEKLSNPHKMMQKVVRQTFNWITASFCDTV